MDIATAIQVGTVSMTVWALGWMLFLKGARRLTPVTECD